MPDPDAPRPPLPPVTLVVEWENAIDVEDAWTARALRALADELAAEADRFAEPPRLLFLYVETAVSAETVPDVLASVAPGLEEVARVEIVPTPGLSYYALKNRGAELTGTGLVVFLDSDAAPRPGWLAALIAPFSDPEVVAVGGFTVLGWEDLRSKAMALSWIFNLPSEGARTERRRKIHCNNCAYRTAYMQAHPFPEVPGAFKKSCGFHLRDLEARGAKWRRTAAAMTVHAPHPGLRFLAWRAWQTGLDRDLQVHHTRARGRIPRLAHAVGYFARKLGRAWWRILVKGGEVDLPVWQRPVALIYPLGFYGVAFAGQCVSALTRRIAPLPEGLLGARPA